MNCTLSGHQLENTRIRIMHIMLNCIERGLGSGHQGNQPSLFLWTLNPKRNSVASPETTPSQCIARLSSGKTRTAAGHCRTQNGMPQRRELVLLPTGLPEPKRKNVSTSISGALKQLKSISFSEPHCANLVIAVGTKTEKWCVAPFVCLAELLKLETWLHCAEAST